MSLLPELKMTKLKGELYDQIKEGVNKIRQRIVDAYADGTISFGEIVSVVGAATRELLLLVNSLAVLTPDQKKAVVLELIDEVYAKDIAPLDNPMVPDWMEPMIDQIIGQVVHVTALQVLNFLLPSTRPREGSQPGVSDR